MRWTGASETRSGSGRVLQLFEREAQRKRRSDEAMNFHRLYCFHFIASSPSSFQNPLRDNTPLSGHPIYREVAILGFLPLADSAYPSDSIWSFGGPIPWPRKETSICCQFFSHLSYFLPMFLLPSLSSTLQLTDAVTIQVLKSPRRTEI